MFIGLDWVVSEESGVWSLCVVLVVVNRCCCVVVECCGCECFFCVVFVGVQSGVGSGIGLGLRQCCGCLVVLWFQCLFDWLCCFVVGFVWCVRVWDFLGMVQEFCFIKKDVLGEVGGGKFEFFDMLGFFEELKLVI